MPTNGDINPTTNPLQDEGFTLSIKYNPRTGAVTVAFPQLDAIGILGMLEFAKVHLQDLRAKANQRVAIPDMQVARKLIT